MMAPKDKFIMFKMKKKLNMQNSKNKFRLDEFQFSFMKQYDCEKQIIKNYQIFIERSRN